MEALIVDDHPLARRGIAAIVGEAFPHARLHEAGSSEEAVAVANGVRPDLVLTDVHMPDSTPTQELCLQLRALLPDAPIVLITAFEQPNHVRSCLEAGATACLLKDSPEDDIISALHSVMGGQVVIDPRVAQRLAVQMVDSGHNDGDVHLTARERQVLESLASGASNRQIAERLVISEATVKGYVSSLLEKLEATSRLEAVVRATDAGLL